MAEALAALRVPFHVAAGSNLPLVTEQLLTPLHAFGFRGAFDAFVCNGADRYRCTFDDQVRIEALRTFDMRRYLGDADFEALLQVFHRALAMPEFQLPASSVAIIGERIEDRGSMINLSPIGRPLAMSPEAYRHRDAFVQFDEASGYRRRMLDYLYGELAGLRTEKGVRITLGGQTSFDVVIDGNDKRYPLRTLLQEGYTSLTYIGDALFEGGNDAAVLDLIRSWPTATPCPVTAVQVYTWQETLEYLRTVAAAASDAARCVSIRSSTERS